MYRNVKLNVSDEFAEKANKKQVSLDDVLDEVRRIGVVEEIKIIRLDYSGSRKMLTVTYKEV